MKIIINNKVFEYPNSSENILNILRTIEQELEDSGQQLEYLLIDGIQVLNDFNDYFLNNIETIEQVEVVVQDLKTLVSETLLSTSRYLVNAIFQMESLAEAFYQTPDQGAWNDLANLLEGIDWILDTVSNIDRLKNLDQILVSYESWNNYVLSVRELISFMPELEEAMKNQDQVLIGDLLLHEVCPVFIKTQVELNDLVTIEGDTHVS